MSGETMELWLKEAQAEIRELKEKNARLCAAITPERFHEIYERLAPNFGYVTREETQHFDPNSPNGRLMTAVCAELREALK